MPRRTVACAALWLASLPSWALGPQEEDGPQEPQPRLERAPPSPDTSRYKDKVDSQGNRYKVDPEGNIITSGTPNPRRQPASAENVNFYYNYAVDLMNRGYAGPALEIYREILSLPSKDEMVMKAQELARSNYEEVRSFNLKNQNLDVSDILFVVRHVEQGRVVYHNEKYRFRIRFPVNWKIEDEVRNNPDEGYASLTLQPQPLPAPNGGKVYMAVGLRAEKLKQNLRVDRYRDSLVSLLQQAGAKTPDLAGLKRQVVPAGAGRLRDRFEVSMDGRRVQGEDLFTVRADFGYYLTFTATPETFETARGIFERFLSDFEIVP